MYFRYSGGRNEVKMILFLLKKGEGVGGGGEMKVGLFLPKKRGRPP